MLKGLTQNYIDAFASKDLGAVMSIFSGDAVLEDPIVNRVVGKKSISEVIGRIFNECESLNFGAKNIFEANGDVTIVEFVLEIDSVQLDGVDVIEWRNGKIIELRAYLDTKEIE